MNKKRRQAIKTWKAAALPSSSRYGGPRGDDDRPPKPATTTDMTLDDKEEEEGRAEEEMPPPPPPLPAPPGDRPARLERATYKRNNPFIVGTPGEHAATGPKLPAAHITAAFSDRRRVPHGVFMSILPFLEPRAVLALCAFEPRGDNNKDKDNADRQAAADRRWIMATKYCKDVRVYNEFLSVLADNATMMCISNWYASSLTGARPTQLDRTLRATPASQEKLDLASETWQQTAFVQAWMRRVTRIVLFTGTRLYHENKRIRDALLKPPPHGAHMSAPYQFAFELPSPMYGESRIILRCYVATFGRVGPVRNSVQFGCPAPDLCIYMFSEPTRDVATFCKGDQTKTAYYFTGMYGTANSARNRFYVEPEKRVHFTSSSDHNKQKQQEKKNGKEDAEDLDL